MQAVAGGLTRAMVYVSLQSAKRRRAKFLHGVRQIRGAEENLVAAPLVTRRIGLDAGRPAGAGSGSSGAAGECAARAPLAGSAMQIGRRHQASGADAACAPAPADTEANARQRKTRCQARLPCTSADGDVGAAPGAAPGSTRDGDRGGGEHTFSKSDEGLVVEVECEDDGMVPVRLGLRGGGLRVQGSGFRVQGCELWVVGVEG